MVERKRPNINIKYEDLGKKAKHKELKSASLGRMKMAKEEEINSRKAKGAIWHIVKKLMARWLQWANSMKGIGKRKWQT
jgi:hypothetical protein